MPKRDEPLTIDPQTQQVLQLLGQLVGTAQMVLPEPHWQVAFLVRNTQSSKGHMLAGMDLHTGLVTLQEMKEGGIGQAVKVDPNTGAMHRTDR